MKNNCIVLTGGGTAGHCIPALALVEDLKKYFDKIEYIGSHNGIEKQIVENYSLKYYGISTRKLLRNFSLKNFLIPFSLIKGFFQARKILKRLSPKIVFSKGGYVAVPVVLAAKSLKIPIVGHESDYSIGLANKIISKVSSCMCTSFADTAKTVKNGIYTGSPIKKEFLTAKKIELPLFYYPTLPNIFVVGGSLGSVTINNYIYENIEELSKKYNIIHIIGKNNQKKQLNIRNYHQLNFVSDIQNYYKNADIIVCRSGSNVIFELLAMQKPMLLIPLPKGNSRGDQVQNSYYFKKMGFANVLEEENYTKKTFLNIIASTLNNKTKYISNMKNNDFKIGNQIIIEQILKNKNA